MLSFPHAKINLGLRITRKRPDGFHDLETCFFPVPEVFDALEMCPSPESSLEIYGMEWNEPQEANLVWKAMDLFRKEEPSLPPLSWFIQKKIPTGAGLGGGSSDASFALRMMAKYCNWSSEDPRLLKLAATLGSDCAFFLQDQAMLGSGRGEILEAFPVDLSAYEIRFVFPGIHISTAKAFAGVVPKPGENSLKEILSLRPEEWNGKLVNDFEESIFPQFPELKKVKDKFYEEGAIYASMSGSGSSMFGIFRKNS